MAEAVIAALGETDEVRSSTSRRCSQKQRIVKLLRLAGELIAALHPDPPDAPEADVNARDWTSTADAAEREALVASRSEQYYETLNVRPHGRWTRR